jgi:hypothetical protein
VLLDLQASTRRVLAEQAVQLIEPRPDPALAPFPGPSIRSDARERLATATMMYREMGMTYWLEKADAEMRESR